MAVIAEISSRYIDELAAIDPVRGARMGVDLGSTELTDYSPAGVERVADLYRRTAEELRAAEPEDEPERLGKLFLLDAIDGLLGIIDAGEPERQVSVLSAPSSSIRMVFDLMPKATADDVARIGARLRNVPA